jgi:hypothetical protein
MERVVPAGAAVQQPAGVVLPWQKAMRQGLLPQLDLGQLKGLKVALESDDSTIAQMGTTVPPAFQVTAGWRCEHACLIGFCGMLAGRRTVGEVNDYFYAMTRAIDQLLGGAGGCWFIMNWWDNGKRGTVFAEALAEVEAEISRREEVGCAADQAR